MSESELSLEAVRVSLLEAVLASFPPDPPYFLSEQRFPAPAICANSFDDLYSARKDLQDFRLLFAVDFSKTTTPAQSTEFISSIRDGLEKNPFFLNEPTTHSYSLPPDTKHLLFWYREATNVKQRVEFLTDFFLQNGIGERDFLIVSSLRSRRSVPEFEHTHVFIRCGLK